MQMVQFLIHLTWKIYFRYNWQLNEDMSTSPLSDPTNSAKFSLFDIENFRMIMRDDILVQKKSSSTIRSTNQDRTWYAP